MALCGLSWEISMMSIKCEFSNCFANFDGYQSLWWHAVHVDFPSSMTLVLQNLEIPISPSKNSTIKFATFYSNPKSSDHSPTGKKNSIWLLSLHEW